MGNAVISGILFQPPHPPNALDIADPVVATQGSSSNNSINNSSSARGSTKTTSTLTKNKHANIDVRYIWVYSKANDNSSSSSNSSIENKNDEWNLIPAVHIKHKEDPTVVKEEDSSSSNSNNSTITTRRYTLLYSHGNAEDIGLITTFLIDLARLLQIDVLCYDYSGYGLSTDVKYVNEFFNLYGNEIVAWKHWCFYGGRDEDRWDECGILPDDDNGSGGGCKYSRSVFVAPIVHPREDDARGRRGDEEKSGGVHNEEEEETSSVYDFTNTCGNYWTTTQDEAAVATTTATTTTRSNKYYDRGTSNSSSSSSHQRRRWMNLHHDNIHNYHTQNSYNSNNNVSSYNNDNGSNSKYVYSQQQSGSAHATPTVQASSQHAWTVPTTSEVKCYANISSVYNYLITIEGVSSKHVILYGKSVGSGPTCWLAQRICTSGTLHRHESSSSLCMEHVGLNSYTDNENEDEEDDNGTMCSGMSLHDEMCFVGDECREPVQQETRSPIVVSSKKKRLADRGGGVETTTAALATTEDSSVIGGVVLHSPFLSVIRVVLDVGFTTLGDLFPNIDRVGDLTCPVYVIHGSEDAIVPFYHGQSLFQHLPDKSKTVPFWARGAGHNNIEMDKPTAYIKRLQQFIRQCDRLNYPNQLSPRKQVKMMKQAQQQQQQASMSQRMEALGRQQDGVFRNSDSNAVSATAHGRPIITRYASQDSYHPTSKQRKQKGTLVMRSVAPPPSSQMNQRGDGPHQSNRVGNNGAHAFVGSVRRSNGGSNRMSVNSPSYNQYPSSSTTIHHGMQQRQHQVVDYGSSSTNSRHVRVRYNRSLSDTGMLHSSPSSSSSHHSSSSSHVAGYSQKQYQHHYQRQQQLHQVQEEQVQYYPPFDNANNRVSSQRVHQQQQQQQQRYRE